MKSMETKYNHKLVEENKYKKWLDENLFECDPESNKPKFSIVIPPPNVTGKLHLGHAWDGSLQDLLIRFKKLNGYDTLWMPGMDHAGIATQAKVEQRLREQNISRYDLGREKFIEKVWDWKEEYAETIRSQWAKLGLSLDYSKECFTFSPELNKIVNHVFAEMFNRGLIYKGKRVINWDPKQQTALSNIEVIYKETKGHMYHFIYKVENSNDFLEVATTRPETMFGDTCVVVNPNDERYQKFIGKNVINPANGEMIPVIADDYVEIDFGTGAMKCTPAHDPNDFLIGQRHNLEQIICMNEDGTMNDFANEFKNLDRFECRKQLIEKCTKEKTFIKAEEIVHQVGYSERSDAIVEPYLSDQWFVKMEPLANDVLNLQKSDNAITFFPERFNQTLEQWMSKTYDWTISRQLWWGHRIPAWYNKNTGEMIVSEEAPTDLENWKQDEDVLDTWFSSALWPFATMQWQPNISFEEQSKLFKEYFPTSVLVTGYDIIFFWVARMIFQSLEFTKQKPFDKVLIHGLIRDEEGRKMSKSLGNGIDPMDVIDEYGCDSLRYFLLTNSTPGQDLRYSPEKIKSSWNFINKIWNASRYVLMNLDDNFKLENNLNEIINKNDSEENAINKWILNKLKLVSLEVKNNLEKYEFTVAGKVLYDFIWNDYCNWYIELSKVNLNSEDKNIIEITKQTLVYALNKILIMLHPFIPFVTEEIYSSLDLKQSILEEEWNVEEFNFEIKHIQYVIDITTSIREFRSANNLKNSMKLNFALNVNDNNEIKKYISNINSYLLKLCNSELSSESLDSNDITSVAVKDYFIEIMNDEFIDKEKVLEQLNQKLEELKNEISRSEKMLSNENFISRASAEKVQAEQDKFDDYKKQFNSINDKLEKLK